ncbi:MAG: hypothetical protein D6721_04320 [Gammaproteobacteria bacterium]|nr:MAG: hypothetical protein D6721_04320 [Gammaproteobacteria bacterium]
MSTVHLPANPALNGLYRGLRQVRQAAGDLAGEAATPGLSPAGTAGALLALHAGERQAQAALRALHAQDRMLGTLLDTLA